MTGRRRGGGERGAVVAAAALAVGAALVLAPPAGARRLPGEGGAAVVAVPSSLYRATLDAHRSGRLLERTPASASAAERLARPPLPGRPDWRSRVISDLRPAADFTTWEIETTAPAGAVARSLDACLAAGGWGGAILAAAGASATVSEGPAPALGTGPRPGVSRGVRAGQGSLTATFDRPFGPLPELLAGCPTAAFAAPFLDEPDGRLRARGDGSALLGRLVVTADPLADADVAAGDPSRPARTSLATAAPDVLLLLQHPSAAEADPLGIVATGAPRLRELLAPDLLLAVFWGSRGAVATGLLPPGVAPARPGLPAPAPSAAPELRLDPLPADAPRLAIVHDAADALVAGTVERLAVILRSRGWAQTDGTDPGPAASPDTTGSDAVPAPTDPAGSPAAAGFARAELLRWRPATLDPALALLSLAGAHSDLLADERLADPALLDPDPDRRLVAVAEIELAWMRDGRVVPLMTADRWIAIDPDLHGVRLREDGVPLLHDAWWSSPR